MLEKHFCSWCQRRILIDTVTGKSYNLYTSIEAADGKLWGMSYFCSESCFELWDCLDDALVKAGFYETTKKDLGAV